MSEVAMEPAVQEFVALRQHSRTKR